VRARSAFIALLLAGSLLAGAAHAQTPPRFLAVAEALVDDLQQSQLTSPIWPNVYGTDPYIVWAGAGSSARTECSSFVTLLWQHTYGWTPATFSSWTGHTSPVAAVYHDEIVAQNDFIRLQTIDELQPGDLIAIVYYPETQSPSGHLMIVEDVPQANSSKPFIDGTNQWTIAVVDSTSSYHGTSDTRYAHPGGIGRGIFRLYTNADGTVAGYTWSLLGTSVASYYAQATTVDSGHHLVLGRLARSIFQSGFESP